MHNWRWYDWIVVTAVWGVLSAVTGAVVAEGTAEELGVLVGFGLGLGGPGYLYARRLIRLARGEAPPGVTTGQMAAERLAEVETRVAELEASQARIWELEERLDFAERLLARGKGGAGDPGMLPGPGAPPARVDDQLATGD